ncbi:MAG: ABC transporter substrate-binding protein, partial [Euryarchaeota archaeon]|nr:ABC transporter substrate-binding protein [Euryarchaeota archaeon]
PDAVFIVATFNPSKMEEVQNKFESLDPTIKVIRFDCFKPLSYIDDVTKMGYILGKKEEADEFVEFYGGWLDTIKERYQDIPLDERPKVYFGSTSDLYKTGGEGSGYHEKLEMAGGNNLFSDLSGYPAVDPEEVVERNPEIIVKAEHISGCGYATNDVTGLSIVRDDIMGRPELANVIAVKNEHVYVISNEILGGAQHFIGIAYMAKWFHPGLFEEIDPQAIHQEYLTEFQGLDYDLDEHGVFVYPPVEMS